MCSSILVVHIWIRLRDQVGGYRGEDVQIYHFILLFGSHLLCYLLFSLFRFQPLIKQTSMLS